jgi:hypothetical protein
MSIESVNQAVAKERLRSRFQKTLAEAIVAALDKDGRSAGDKIRDVIQLFDEALNDKHM